MTNEIKEIYLSSLYWTKTHDNMGGVMADCVFKNNMSYEEFKKLRNKKYFVLCDKDYITNLQEELEYVRKQNNDLRKIYRNTYKRYQEQGNDEMAGYFMAQIDECRTFYVESVVDYYMLSKQLQERINKAIEYIETHQLNFKKGITTFGSERLSMEERKLLDILRGYDK